MNQPIRVLAEFKRAIFNGDHFVIVESRRRTAPWEIARAASGGDGGDGVTLPEWVDAPHGAMGLVRMGKMSSAGGSVVTWLPGGSRLEFGPARNWSFSPRGIEYHDGWVSMLYVRTDEPLATDEMVDAARSRMRITPIDGIVANRVDNRPIGQRT